jgi:membrane fusion protein (multidrug efflux system)
MQPLFNIPKQFWQQLSHLNKKTIKICLLIFVVLFSYYLGKNLLIKHFIQQFLKTPPTIGVSKVKQKNWHENYHTIGQLKAYKAINLSAQSAGVITKIHIHAGQQVQPQELLIQLENQADKAQLKVQVAELKLQQRLFQQQEQLWQKKVISESQYFQAKANLEKAKALVQSQRAHLHDKQIRAPFAGILGIPEVYVGQYISPGQQHVASLQSIDKLFLDFTIPEKYFPLVKKGESIGFKTDIDKHDVHQATIIAIEPNSSKQAHSIWIRAQVNNTDARYIPGLFAHINLSIHQSNNIISIPTSAILGSPQGAMVYVANKKNNPDTKAIDWWIEKRLIKIGSARRDQTLVINGLRDQEWIVTSGTQKVHDASFAKTKTQ